MKTLLFCLLVAGICYTVWRILRSERIDAFLEKHYGSNKPEDIKRSDDITKKKANDFLESAALKSKDLSRDVQEASKYTQRKTTKSKSREGNSEQK